MKHLTDLLEVDPNGPEVRRARSLVREDRRLLRNLIAMRRALDLSQDDVAKRLGITQPTIAAFERYDSDPKLSTIRRYAQALGVLVCHHVERDRGQLADGGWPPPIGWTAVPATMEPSVANTAERELGQIAAPAPDRGHFALAA